MTKLELKHFCAGRAAWAPFPKHFTHMAAPVISELLKEGCSVTKIVKEYQIPRGQVVKAAELSGADWRSVGMKCLSRNYRLSPSGKKPVQKPRAAVPAAASEDLEVIENRFYSTMIMRANPEALKRFSYKCIPKNYNFEAM